MKWGTNGKIVATIGLALPVLAMLVWVCWVFVLFPLGANARERARATTTEMVLDMIRNGLHSHRMEYSSYPTGSAKDVFDALEGRNPRGIRFVMLNRSVGGIPLDGWKREVVLTAGGAAAPPALHSKGQDGIDQGGAPGSDDIVR